jgi:MFS family permease
MTASVTARELAPSEVRIRAVAPAEGPSLLTLVVLLAGVFLSIVDFFVVNVALPTIGGELHATPATLEFVGLVLGGRLGDRYGRRRLFLVGMTFFTLMSLACGVAPTAGTLIGARVLQGLAASLMVPQVLATIQATTTGATRTRALGFYGATAGIAGVIGQVLGGVLLAANIGGSSWRAVFLINVPIGVTALVLAPRVIPETQAERPAAVDPRGTALLGLTIVSLLVPLAEGRPLGWPVWTWIALASCPLFGYGFFRIERHIERSGRLPLLPPSLIALPSLRRGLMLGAPFFLGFGGFMFVYVLAVQDALHWSPLRAGLGIVPMAAGQCVSSLLSGRMLGRLGKRVIGYGAIVQCVGLVGLVLTVTVGWHGLSVLDLLPAMVVAGFGQGMVMSPLFGTVLSQVPVELAGVGGGVLVTMQQTALALGVAALGTLYLAQSGANRLGTEGALALVLGLQAVIAVSVAVQSRRLPDPA